MASRSASWEKCGVALLALLVLIAVLVAVVSLSCYAVQVEYTFLLGSILVPSMRCNSFDDWVQMVRASPYIQSEDLTPLDVEVPLQPHILLGNHIQSHFSIGSFLTVALAAPASSKIVCYTSYNHMVLIGPVTNRILRDQIRIGCQDSRERKERNMVDGIRRSLDAGHSVIVLVDAESTKPMRTLYHKVLQSFPTVLKQVLHVMEPARSNRNRFRFQRYHATRSLEEVVSTRQSIVQEA